MREAEWQKALVQAGQRVGHPAAAQEDIDRPHRRDLGVVLLHPVCGLAQGGYVITGPYSYERAKQQLQSCVSLSAFSGDLCLMTDSPRG